MVKTTNIFQRRHYVSLARWVAVHNDTVISTLIMWLGGLNDNFNEEAFLAEIEDRKKLLGVEEE